MAGTRTTDANRIEARLYVLIPALFVAGFAAGLLGVAPALSTGFPDGAIALVTGLIALVVGIGLLDLLV